MGSDVCEACGEGTVTLDHVYGILACENCGRVVDDVETQLASHHQEGHVLDRGGVFVRDGDDGAFAAGMVAGSGQLGHAFITRNDMNKVNVMKKMKEITAILRVPHDRVEDVQFMLEQLLDGEWGQGRWINILVGACIYISIRQNRLPLTLMEVASAIDCDVMELGRMYRRVLHTLKLDLPDADPVIFLDRAIASLPPIKVLGREMTRKMSKQGSLLLECSQQWFITTGRRPLPVVAAVLALVSDANQVKVSFDDIVQELYSNLRTSRTRYKELKEALVGVGQKLPWGKDITVKSLDKHLPFLLQFLEVDMKRTKKRKNSPLGSTQLIPLATRSRVEEEVFRVSKEADHSMMIIPQPISARDNDPEPPDARPGPSGQDGRRVELQLVRALKMKEVKWQAWPKSFLASEDAHSRRCFKINAANERIAIAKQSMLSIMRSDEAESPLSGPPKLGRVKAFGLLQEEKVTPDLTKPSHQTKSSLDWEDLIIEYLLLRGVDRKQLEDGYYKAALGAHHILSTDQIDDSELIPYLRSKAEVSLLKVLQDEGGFLEDTDVPF